MAQSSYTVRDRAYDRLPAYVLCGGPAGGHIGKIGLVTDSALADLAQRLASHFVAAEIKHFPAGEREAAKQWIMGRR